MRTLLAAAILLFLSLGAARAQVLEKPVLLVAQADLQGVYSRTVVLVVPAAHGQHLGFILNRVTDVKLGNLFPEHEPSAKVVDPVYFGGPEMMQSIFAVVTAQGDEMRGLPSLHLFGKVFVTGNAAAVDRIIEQRPNDARYFAGFVGWQRGELAKELEAGFWHVTEPDEKLLFREPAGMWEELRKQLSGWRV
jgi:putative transcriptional regulator